MEQPLNVGYFGDAVRRQREARGWTVYRLAQRAGVSAAYLSSLEKGEGSRPGIEVVARIAQALDLTTDDMLREAGFLPPADTAPRTPQELATIYRELGYPGRRALVTVGHALREMQGEYAEMVRARTLDRFGLAVQEEPAALDEPLEEEEGKGE